MTPKSILQMVLIFAGCYLLFILVQATSQPTHYQAAIIQQDLSISSDKCESSSSHQVELSDCYQHLINDQEKLYKQILKAKQQELVDLANTTNRPDALNAYIQANKLFFGYRKAQCNLKYQEMMPGSGAGIAYKKCIIDLTATRIKHLQD